jgi:hypothetical protein
MASERRDQPGVGKNKDKVDRASADSFPASDPPSYSGITGAGNPENKRARQAKPTGSPTSDRHATETAQQREDQERPDTPKQGRD